MKLLIESKHPTRYGGMVEKELVRMLRRFGWAGEHDHPVTIMSFAPIALRRIRLLAPPVPMKIAIGSDVDHEFKYVGSATKLARQLVPARARSESQI